MRKKRLLKVSGPLALVLLTFVVHPATAAAANGPVTSVWSDTCSVPGIQQLCDFGSWISKLVPNAISGVGGDAAKGFFETFDAWVISGAVWALDHVITLVQATTAVTLNVPWFQAHYSQMIALSAFVIMPILIIAAGKAAFTGESTTLAVALFIFLPFTIALTFIAVPVVNLVIGSVDWMSNVASNGLGADYAAFAHNVAVSLGSSGSGSQAVAPIIGVISAFLILIFGFLIILELVCRNAALYVAVVFIPLALAQVVIPSTANIAKHMGNTLAVIVLSKFFIVASLAIGVAALKPGNQCLVIGGTCSSFSIVLAGVVILLIAAVVPIVLVRFLPRVGGAAVASVVSRDSVTTLAQPNSAGIYSNIRRDTETRLAVGGAGGGRPFGRGFGGGSRGFGGRGLSGGGLIGPVAGTGAAVETVGRSGGNVRGGPFSRGSFFGGRSGRPRRWGLGGGLKPSDGTPKTPR